MYQRFEENTFSEITLNNSFLFISPKMLTYEGKEHFCLYFLKYNYFVEGGCYFEIILKKKIVILAIKN